MVCGFEPRGGGSALVKKRKKSRGKETIRNRGEYRTVPGKAAKKIIDAKLKRSNATLRQVAAGIRRLVKRAVPKSQEAINPWGIPTFDFHGPLCFLMIGKHHVTFGFPRGTSLPDPGGLLEGTGKNMRHVKLKEAEQLRNSRLRQLIVKAAKLNRETPLTPSMRVKRKS
ncbi:MAG: DUF1801 domain-containing protein [Candidatus Acidiferrales bacterium]